MHKLLNANLELSTEELQRHMADQNDFTVIGVLGCQGAGKSTVMSLLAGAGWRREPGEAGQLADPPFAPQSLDAVLQALPPPLPALRSQRNRLLHHRSRLRRRPTPPQATHQTVGVDVAVTSERLILLDTHPRCARRRGPALCDDTAPSARLVAPQAQAAPTHPRAQFEHLASSPRPQQPASGRPTVEDSAPVLRQATAAQP